MPSNLQGQAANLADRDAGVAEQGQPLSLDAQERPASLDGFHRSRRRVWLSASTLCTAGVLTLMVGLTIGPMHFSLADLLRVIWMRLTGEQPDQRLTTAAIVLIDIRLPRMLAAAIIGAALSSSGAAFQAVFANPLISPGILGVLAGSSFGAALGILYDFSWPAIQIMAFVAGLSAAGLALVLSRGVPGRSVLAMVLGGVISTALFTALLSLVKMVADPTSQLPAIVFWLMGSLSHVDLSSLSLAAPVMGAAIVGLSLLGGSLDVLTMGDEEAAALGLPVKSVRMTTVALATLAGSLSVSLAGVVGWVGLVVPHIVRGLFGSMNRWVLPASALVGAIFLMVVDTVCRSLLSTEIPLGIVTSLIGAPFLAALLRRGAKGWSE